PAFSARLGSRFGSSLSTASASWRRLPTRLLRWPSQRATSGSTRASCSRSASSRRAEGREEICRLRVGTASAPRAQYLGEPWHDLMKVADDPEVRELEDRCGPVAVDHHDDVGALHADLVLDRAGDATADEELWRHGSSGLPDL